MSADDFTVFQDTFKKYQKEFGLTGYTVYFKHEDTGNSFADIEAKVLERVALVRMNNKVTEEFLVPQNPALSAKHEAIHLLLAELEHCARCRYVQPEEVDKAAEDIVVKLESLIPDVK